MEKSKIINADNFDSWLASTGFLFPTNELEIARFNKLFSELDEQLTGKEIDPERILNGQSRSKVVRMNNQPTVEKDFSAYRMVARNGSNLPKHILDKMKKNQSNSKPDDSTSEEENNK